MRSRIACGTWARAITRRDRAGLDQRPQRLEVRLPTPNTASPGRRPATLEPARSSGERRQAVGDELGAEDQQEYRHDGVVVQDEPVLELVQPGLRVLSADQVVEDRRRDAEAGRPFTDYDVQEVTALASRGLVQAPKAPAPPEIVRCRLFGPSPPQN